MKTLFPLFILLVLFSCKQTEEKKIEIVKDSVVNTDIAPNCDHLIMSILWYQHSAEMKACYLQAYNWAKKSLDESLKKNTDKSKQNVVVVDIDETILDNSPFEVKCVERGKGYSSESWKEWTDKAQATALPGAVEFLNYAKSKGVETIYITNRKLSEKEATVKNLTDLGFPFIDDQHFIPKTKDNSKKARRDSIALRYNILLLIGDNLTDFTEIFENRDSTLGMSLVDEYKDELGSRFIMLPNPMYGEWETAIYNNDNKILPEAKDSLRRKYLIGY